MSWSRPFDHPIPLPRGRRQLVTLQDAGTYITKLPKAEHEAQEWQAAVEGVDPGGVGGRADDVCAHRHHVGLEPTCGTRVQSRSQRPPLGKTQAEERPMTRAAQWILGGELTPAKPRSS